MAEPTEELLTVENMRYVLGYLEEFTILDVPRIRKSLAIMEQKVNENTDLRDQLKAKDARIAELERQVLGMQYCVALENWAYRAPVGGIPEGE